jgi:hypothetical protein
MIEIGIAEYFSMSGVLGIIGSMFTVLYFSRKQMKTLSADIKNKMVEIYEQSF